MLTLKSYCSINSVNYFQMTRGPVLFDPDFRNTFFLIPLLICIMCKGFDKYMLKGELIV